MSFAFPTENARKKNPRCTCTRVTVVILCVCAVPMSVCLCICYHKICYIPRLYVQNKVHHGVLYGVFRVCHVALAENSSFKSSGIIWRSSLLSLLPNELSMDKIDSNGFFSTKLVSRPSISSYNMTDLSLIMLR